MHKIYVLEENTTTEKGESDIVLEQALRRRHLETSVKNLRTKLKKDQDAHEKEERRKMKENVQLLMDINDLKRLAVKLELEINKSKK